jgi:hypothetical protein
MSYTIPLPDQDYLNSILIYYPNIGKLYWKADPSVEAFTTLASGKYYSGEIEGIKYLAHRIIWKMIYGNDPNTIDHINGESTDNTLINLRETDSIQIMDVNWGTF